MSEEVATPEVVAPEVTETPNKEVLSESIASKFESLSAAEESVQARRAQFEEKARLKEELTTIRGVGQTDRAKALELLGVKLEDIQELATEESDPFEDLRQQVELLKNELSSTKEETSAKAKASVLEQVRQEVHSFVDKSDSYPMLQAAGTEAKDLVYQAIVQAHETGGVVLSEDQAASEVEDKLQELFERMSSAAPAKTKSKVTTPSLTNAMAGTPARGLGYADLSREERKAQLSSRLNSLISKG